MNVHYKKKIRAEALLYIFAFKRVRFYLKEIQKYALSDFHPFLSGVYHYGLN